MKIKINLFATLFYSSIVIFSLMIFSLLTKNWYFPYNLLLVLLPLFLILLLTYLILKIPIFKLDSFLKRKKILKIFLMIFFTIILLLIIYSYNLPNYYYIILLIFSIFFWFSRYYILYGIAILLLSTTFLIFQFFYIEQELLLNYLESKEISNMHKEILKELEIQKEKNQISILHQKRGISFKIPENFEEINKTDFEFPLIYIGKPKSQELPIFSCFIIKNNFPLQLLDLRIKSIITQLKKSERIETHQTFKNPYLESHLKNSSIQNQFYLYYDRFYAATIQIGYYAVPFNNHFIVFWIRELQKPGFPHDSKILQILNSISIKNNK